MTIGGIQAFVSYLTFMMWPIQEFARVYAEMQHSIASAETDLQAGRYPG